MGQLITTVAGGFVGFALGGPLGAQIGMTLGGMVGASLFGPTIKGPRLTDLKVTASTYGTAIVEVWGTVRVGGNLIWTTGIKETKHKSGGLGGKGGPKQTTYSYDATFAVALCKGEIDGLPRIWADGKLIYDATGGSSRFPSEPDAAASAVDLLLKVGSKKKKNVKFRVYRGTEDQLPDSLIEADKGAGNVSAHRGIAYVVFEKLQLEDFGNRIPQLTFEVTKNSTANFPNLQVETADSDPVPDVTTRTWIPDWELGRLFSWSSSQTDVFNLDTMKKSYGVDFSMAGGFRRRYVPTTGLYFKESGSANSRPMEVWDLLSFAQVDEIGKEAMSLDGSYLNACGNPDLSIGALGQMGCCYAKASQRVLHLLMIGWTRTVWAFRYGSDIPIFHATASFDPTFILTGKQDDIQSEMIAWRNTNNRLELEVWRISAGAEGDRSERDPPPDCPSPSYTYKSSGDFSKTRIDLTPFSGEAYSAHAILYDPTDDHLFSIGLSNGVPCAFKFSLINGTYKFAVKHAGLALPYQTLNYSRLAGGTFGYCGKLSSSVGGNRYWVEIDLQSGANARNDLVSAADFEDVLWLGANQQWDDESASLLVQTRTNYRRVFFRAGSQKIYIADVVQDVCLKTNVLTIADIDTSGLADETLVGYMIDRETTGRDVIKQLATGFLFDGYESDYKLKFRSRGNASQVTIPEDWIGRNSDGLTVKETITQELEMPMRTSVNYYDITRDHQQGSQTMKRKAGPVPTMWTSKEDVIDLPIVWTPDDAKQCADKILKMAWANRTSFTMSLPFRYLKYDPTDVATVTLNNGTSYFMRLSDMDIGADYTVEAQGVSEKAAAYVSTLNGNAGEAPDQSISDSYPAIPIIINTPLLRDVDYDASNNAICYLAAKSNSLTFSGAAIFIDDGYEYSAIGSVQTDAVNGLTLNALPETTAYESTDESFALNVRLNSADDTLQSVTQEDMLNNFTNAALVGDEIIQFRDAVQNEDLSWTLAGILRARRGTNYAVNLHSVAERFILLDEATMTRFLRSPQDYNVTKEFRAVPNGSLIEDAVGYPTTLIPRDLMPYTPEDIQISDDGTDVTITMQRRSRITAPLLDGTGVIPYKEGQKVDAKISYKLWAGLTIADTTTAIAPTSTGDIALFDSIGVDIDASLTFPLTTLVSEDSFLLRLAEIGAVEGTPKWIAFERLGEDRWNAASLY